MQKFSEFKKFKEDYDANNLISIDDLEFIKTCHEGPGITKEEHEKLLVESKENYERKMDEFIREIEAEKESIE